MAKEIERKYFLPFGVRLNPDAIIGVNKIRQGYIDYEKDERLKQEIESTLGQEVDFETIKEARVRQKGEGENAKYFLTLKSDGTLEREEIEQEISKVEFESFWNSISLGKIEKTRYEVAFELATAEVDRYEGDLKGLYTAEYEYNPDEVDHAYLLQYNDELINNSEDPCIDVTSYKCFKNKNLAKAESLDEVYYNFRKEGKAKMDERERAEEQKRENMTPKEIEAEELRELNSTENTITSW